MAITSNTSAPRRFGDVDVADWAGAGLLKPSRVKPVIVTIQRNLVRRRLGHLGSGDITALSQSLSEVLG